MEEVLKSLQGQGHLGAHVVEVLRTNPDKKFSVLCHHFLLMTGQKFQTKLLLNIGWASVATVVMSNYFDLQIKIDPTKFEYYKQSG